MTSSQKSCFVIMPIRKRGSPEYAHFREIYEGTMKPAAESRGYQVTRADEVQEGGAITRDIVLRLAEADVVIADLTDLNPNVFYELGVRHSMRGRGTVLVLDENRSPDIPFDLSAYRVIKFRGELTGIRSLRAELSQYIDRLEAIDPADGSSRDNPVHDWLPMLPLNAISAAERSSEGALRTQLADAQRRLREYQQRYGLSSDARTSEGEPLGKIEGLLAASRNGGLPSDLLEKAEEATKRRDTGAFLEACRLIVDTRTVRPSSEQCARMIFMAGSFEIEELSEALYDFAHKAYPGDKRLSRARLGFFAHSAKSEYRQRAREELLKQVGVTIDGGRVQVPGSATNDATTALLGFLLDAYQRDDLNLEALRITEALVATWGATSSAVLRNHARALENMGRSDESLSWYVKSVLCADVDCTSAIWLGNELHNRRRHVDAAEAYALAATLDPDDDDAFSHLARELCVPSRTPSSRREGRPMPETSTERMVDCVRAALSCSKVSQAVVERCRDACSEVGVEMATVVEKRLSALERAQVANECYKLLASALTSKAPPERAPASS